jgi:pyruvate/2-oxoglutarate dehydrogenase complex dihydrolipoamide acyltransferase (E2) component
MHDEYVNKYRAAIEVLQRGREVLVANLADEILERQDDLSDGGFLLNEFLEANGTRLHFLCLLVSQLEQSAEALEETRPDAPLEPTPPTAQQAPVPAPKPAAKRRPRAKKIAQPAADNRSPDES